MITLPLPPSINHYYGRSKDGRMYKTTKAKDWEQEAGYLFLNHKKYGDKLVIVEYNFYFPNNKSDYGNRAKILDDVLEKANIIDNDKQIMEAHIYKFIDGNNPRVEVSISRYE